MNHAYSCYYTKRETRVQPVVWAEDASQIFGDIAHACGVAAGRYGGRNPTGFQPVLCDSREFIRLPAKMGTRLLMETANQPGFNRFCVTTANSLACQ